MKRLAVLLFVVAVVSPILAAGNYESNAPLRPGVLRADGGGSPPPPKGIPVPPCVWLADGGGSPPPPKGTSSPIPPSTIVGSVA